MHLAYATVASDFTVFRPAMAHETTDEKLFCAMHDHFQHTVGRTSIGKVWREEMRVLNLCADRETEPKPQTGFAELEMKHADEKSQNKQKLCLTHSSNSSRPAL